MVGGTIQQLTGGASPTFGLARYLVTPGCRVPDVRGRLLARARATLVSAGCSVGAVTHALSKKVKRGRVISEHPAPGTGTAGAREGQARRQQGPSEALAPTSRPFRLAP